MARFARFRVTKATTIRFNRNRRQSASAESQSHQLQSQSVSNYRATFVERVRHRAEMTAAAHITVVPPLMEFEVSDRAIMLNHRWVDDTSSSDV